MTIGEAIRLLDPETNMKAIEAYEGMESYAIDEACKVAISALRAQQHHTLDRSKWWCAHCNDMAAKQSMIMHGENYCCNCGCPLTEEAWAETERRIGGNDGTISPLD